VTARIAQDSPEERLMLSAAGSACGAGHLKGLKVRDYREGAASFLGVSVRQPGANRSDRVKCTELPAAPGENSALST